MTSAQVATLANTDGTVGENLLATGWGALTQGGASPIDLQRVEVPLVDRANCNDTNSYNGQITDLMICAGRDTGGIDTCQGDSGGPLTGGTNHSVLTGITSWGFGCAQPNLFGVYTRVSQQGIREFITRTAGINTSNTSNKDLCLIDCRTERDSCMADVGTPGSPSQQQCVRGFRACQAECLSR